MTTQLMLAPIAGAYHRPPAKVVLEHLPQGALVELVPEPENPWDSSAIRVEITAATMEASPDFDGLCQALPTQGFDWEQIKELGRVQLGYIARSGGKPLATAQAQCQEPLAGNAEVMQTIGLGIPLKAEILFAGTGQVLVRIEWDAEAADKALTGANPDPDLEFDMSAPNNS